MFCWIRNVWDIQWIGFKVKIRNLRNQQDFLSCFDDKIDIENNGCDG